MPTSMLPSELEKALSEREQAIIARLRAIRWGSLLVKVEDNKPIRVEATETTNLGK